MNALSRRTKRKTDLRPLMAEQPWQDAETLREMYVGKGMSTVEIADELGCSDGTVSKWLNRHDVETRSIGEAMKNRYRRNPVPFGTSHQGYERWKTAEEREANWVGVHRLAAVAWFGYEAVNENLVHHENDISWDNREENLQPMTRGEHNRVHIRNPEGRR